ncbi:MAG: EamA family transporter RarD [Holophagales bacterium]|nr:EamA family transporter RarD [Holophagales bacterium]
MRRGTWAAIASYGMWGLFPIYWKQIAHIDAVQILCHRIVWSAAFLLLALLVAGAIRELWPLFKNKSSFLPICLCAILITANWGIYIWAVNSGHITESSLGYYITPLLSVALGRLFFKEKLSRWTIAALVAASLGVAIAAAMIGKPPLVALSLAGTFSFYSAVKKKAGLDALSGLAAETIVAAPFAVLWLCFLGPYFLDMPGIFGPDVKSASLLVIAGPVTAVPLLTFAYAANRLPLHRIGFIQYFSPTIQLALGLAIYGERIGAPMAVAFAAVVVAVALYYLGPKLQLTIDN